MRTLRVAWRALRILTSVLSTLAAIAVCAAVVYGVWGSRTGRFQVATVVSASMRPTFDVGTMVITVPTPATELRVGDVIAYYPCWDKGGPPVVHRVWSVENPGSSRPTFRTKGDNNNAPDRTSCDLTTRDFQKAVRYVPKLGWVALWVRQPGHRPYFIWGSAAVGGLIGVLSATGAARRPPRRTRRRSRGVGASEPAPDPPAPPAAASVLPALTLRPAAPPGFPSRGPTLTGIPKHLPSVSPPALSVAALPSRPAPSPAGVPQPKE